MEQNNNWKQQELEEMGAHEESVYEKLPALKLVENVPTEIVVDFSKKFEKYETTNEKGKVVKAIIPVEVKGVKHNFWLNKKNPLYRELLKRGENLEKLKLTLMQVGNQKNTKYIIVG